LLPFLNRKTRRALGIAVDFVSDGLFKVQKGDKFQLISTENLFQLPGKKDIEKRPLEKLLSEDLGLSEVFLKSLSEVCIKISERR